MCVCVPVCVCVCVCFFCLFVFFSICSTCSLEPCVCSHPLSPRVAAVRPICGGLGMGCREVRTTELLRARFGEEYLRKCAVMIKDFTNSRRLHQVFASSGREATAGSTLDFTAESVHVYVLSRLFWPGLKKDTIQLPQVCMSVCILSCSHKE